MNVWFAIDKILKMNKISSNKKAVWYKTTIPYLLLPSRLFLFLFFQVLIAFVVNSWEASQKYWLLTATMTNIVSIMLLIILFKKGGNDYFRIFSFNKATIKKDIIVFIGLIILALPIVFVPAYLISMIIWGDPNIPTAMMFGPIGKWLVYVLLFAFPVTIAFAELATYFGYIMSILKNKVSTKWLAPLLPVIFLSIQHCTMPFIPDLNFIVYRGLMFLPFSILVGLSIYHRPSLFPYFVILHGLLDFGTAFMFL